MQEKQTGAGICVVFGHDIGYNGFKPVKEEPSLSSLSFRPWQYQNSAPMPMPPRMLPTVTGSRFLSRKFAQVRAERSTPDSAASWRCSP